MVSAERRKEYSSIVKACCALLFFSVPHGWIDLKDVEAMALKQNPQRIGLINEFIHATARNTQGNMDFINILDNNPSIRIVSYYEKWKTPRLEV